MAGERRQLTVMFCDLVGSTEPLLRDSIDGWRAFGSSWMELRSVLLLGRLALRTGKKEAARERLAALYAGFTKGFEMKRLRDARKLLEELT